MGHKCEPGWDSEAEKHVFPCGNYGPAILYCIEREGKGEFWVSNDEYVGRVNYCPFCGAKAPAQVNWQPEAEDG